MENPKPNGWHEWSKHVLLELERLGKEQNETDDAMTSIKVEIAMLKVKSGVWGAIGGLIPVLIYIAFKIL